MQFLVRYVHLLKQRWGHQWREETDAYVVRGDRIE